MSEAQAKPLPRWLDAQLQSAARHFECSAEEVEQMREAARNDLVAASRFYADWERRCKQGKQRTHVAGNSR